MLHPGTVNPIVLHSGVAPGWIIHEGVFPSGHEIIPLMSHDGRLVELPLLELEEEPEDDPLDEPEEEVLQRGAAEPEGEQIISAAILSLRLVKQLAALPPELLEPIHLIQVLLEGHVGTRPFVQYG